MIFLRSDDEKFLGKKFDEMIAALGITHESFASYISQQNEHSKRLNEILMMKTRALRIESFLSISL